MGSSISSPASLDIHFAEPPPDQAEGGIDLAMTTLTRYLQEEGVSIHRRATASDVESMSPHSVVHFHGLWQPQHSWMSFRCRRAGIPYIVSPHGMLEPWAWRKKRWKKWPYYFLVERRHLRGARRVLVTSDLEADHVSRFVSADRIASIPLALLDDVSPDYDDARRELGWSSDEAVLLYLSRIHEKKGLHLLLSALANAHDTIPSGVRLAIVGDGPASYLTQLQRIEKRHEDKLPPIDWVGPVWSDKKWRYLQGADLFCLPTHSENFGVVVLEACQVGTPVLTTVHTPWHFLEDWESGLVVEPQEEALQKALTQFFTAWDWSTRDRHRFSQRTRERFDLSVVGPQYLSLYKSIVSATH